MKLLVSHSNKYKEKQGDSPCLGTQLMFYTIYQITNKINSKIYIGKHKTEKIDDAYMGSGTHLQRAIKKYGIENFSKEILFTFDNEDEMNRKESELVSEQFIKEDTNYNLCIGGNGGWSYVINNGHHIKRNKDPDRRKKISESHMNKKRSLEHRESISKSLKGRNCHWLKGKKRPNHSVKMSGGNNPISIKIEYDGKVYETIKDMSNQTNISYYLIKKMINNGEVKVYNKEIRRTQ